MKDLVPNHPDNPFLKVPSFVYILVLPDEEGMYTMHTKLPDGTCMTFPYKLELQEVAVLTADMNTTLNLPENATLIKVTDAVMNKPNIANRKIKHVIKNGRARKS